MIHLQKLQSCALRSRLTSFHTKKAACLCLNLFKNRFYCVFTSCSVTPMSLNDHQSIGAYLIHTKIIPTFSLRISQLHLDSILLSSLPFSPLLIRYINFINHHHTAKGLAVEVEQKVLQAPWYLSCDYEVYEVHEVYEVYDTLRACLPQLPFWLSSPGFANFALDLIDGQIHETGQNRALVTPQPVLRKIYC